MTQRLLLYIMALFLYLFIPYLPSEKGPQLSILAPEVPALTRAYLWGDKTQLKSKIKKAHQRLSLSHLLTPSGLHLSALLFLMYPLIMFFKSSHPLGVKIFYNFFSLMFFFMPGLYALKRIALLRILIFMRPLLRLPLDYFNTFLICFTLDALFGTFSYSPLSFFYSFLFLGTIFSEKSFGYLALSLFVTQLFIACLTGTAFYPLGSILGILISSLFIFIFPFFILGLFFPNFFFISFYEDTLIKISNLCDGLGTYFPGVIILLLILIYSSEISQKKKKWFLILLLFHSSPLFNIKDFSKRRPFNVEIKDRVLKEIKRTRTGYKMLYDGNGICRHKLYNSFYEKKCL